jgi:hypothetical protein
MWTKIGTARICVDGLVGYDYKHQENVEPEEKSWVIYLEFKGNVLDIKLDSFEEVEVALKDLDRIFLGPYSDRVKILYKDMSFKGE